MGASEDFKAVLLKTLYPFLEKNELGESDGPILVVEPLVHMPKVNAFPFLLSVKLCSVLIRSSIKQQDKIDEMMDAMDRHAENINGAGICYKFSSYKALKDAKEHLCNSDQPGQFVQQIF